MALYVPSHVFCFVQHANQCQILFFEDPAHVKPFQEKFPTFKQHFQPWADHSNAMHQYFRMFSPFL